MRSGRNPHIFVVMNAFHRVLILVIMLWTPVGAAKGMQSTGVGEAAFQDPVRRVPPVRISIGAAYQQWTLEDNSSLQETSFPLSLETILIPNLSLNLGVSQAIAEGDNYEQVTGLTDFQVGLNYQMLFQRSRLTLSLGIVAPTGDSKLSTEAYDTAFQLGIHQFGFRVAHFGQGTVVAPSLALVSILSQRFVVSLAASFRIRGEFEPVANLPEAYDLGNELLFAAGAVYRLGPQLDVSADVLFTQYSEDTVGGGVVYEPGNRFTAMVQLHRHTTGQDLWLALRYRTIDTNNILTNGTLQPEFTPAFPGFLQMSAQYRVRLATAIRTTIHASRTSYEASFPFDELDIIGVGVSPEFTLSPSFSVPLHATYRLGDIEGIDVGISLIAVF